MKLSERLAFAALYNIDPERGHGISITALKNRLTHQPGVLTSPRLKTNFAGIELPNPIGLAAGFDKNAEVIEPLLRTGFGFIEVGAATPLPQPGNPKPRLFRLREEQASINRFGFNNEGADDIAARLASRPAKGIVGINLGANKTSEDKAADFARVLNVCGPHVDFATVNVSSPNTEKLRDLQGKEALTSLLQGVLDARSGLSRTIPILLKIAPDLSESDLEDIAEVALATGIDGIVATNTTLDRDGLTSEHKGEAGGLAGQPLFEKSTRVLARLSQLVGGKIPLIGVGGVSNADQAYQKIRAGASVVQFYTALVYGGFSMVETMVKDLDTLLQRDGFDSVSEAVGVDRDRWL